MKKWLLSTIILISTSLVALSGCVSSTQTTEKSLVAYFSYSGTTQTFANDIAKLTLSDIYRIEAEVPYTQEDLNVKNKNSRAYLEQNNADARPAIANPLPNLDKYQVIYLGYPIWLGKAPKVVYSFVEKYNLKGKTVIPFCTSHMTGMGDSAEFLKALVPEAIWKTGQGFTADDDEIKVKTFLDKVN
ncbi:MAG: flavodoxin [Succinatimonas sp.]|nr:flavodoxin [Succinatimonas sp.]